MKNYLLFLLLTFSVSIFAQPTFIGTMIVDGNYNTFNLNDLGAFRQVRLQATSSAGASTRIWEFATGNYFENWRPYTFPTTIVMNQVINPAVDAASARYNDNFGGASSWLPAITSGNFYTFNVTEFAPPTDQFMSFLETTFNPATISTVAANPAGNPNENVPVDITVTTSADPAAGEQVFVRYTTDNFVTTSLVELSFTGSSGTAQIPGLPEGTMVQYYIYSSNETAANIATSVAANGEVAHDMLTLNLNNNGGVPYAYTVQEALPVELSSFWARPRAKDIELKWETASEINNSHFDIEKSMDAREWNSIAKIEGNGNVSVTSQYNFIDTAPSKGVNYYRLRQFDYDGEFSYSPVVSVNWEKENNVELYPNPAKDQLFFKHIDLSAGDIKIAIFDVNGRQVFDGYLNDNSINIANLGAGLYLVQGVQNGAQFSERFFVQ